jgi:hypothetical protein
MIHPETVALWSFEPSKQPCERGIHAKIVVGMQHTPTTSFGKLKTPKKAAVACLFSFTQRVPHRRLWLGYGNSLQSIIAVPGAFEIGLF